MQRFCERSSRVDPETASQFLANATMGSGSVLTFHKPDYQKLARKACDGSAGVIPQTVQNLVQRG
jgi:hypothetical protein